MPTSLGTTGWGAFLSQMQPASAPFRYSGFCLIACGLWAWRTTMSGTRESSALWETPLPLVRLRRCAGTAAEPPGLATAVPGFSLVVVDDLAMIIFAPSALRPAPRLHPAGQVRAWSCASPPAP